MKNFFTTLMALAIVATSFAQVKQADISQRKPLPERTNFNIKNERTLTKQKGGSFMFNYLEAAMDFYGMDPNTADGFGPYLLFDGKASMPGGGAVQFFSVGQVFYFGNNAYDYWGDMLQLELGAPYMPSLPQGSGYNIDSIQLLLAYSRGTNVPETAVDTLLISYALDCDNDPFYTIYNTQTGDTLLYSFMPTYDRTTYGFVTAEEEEGTSSTRTVFSQKIPLTIDDTTGFSFFSFPVDPVLQNISGMALMAAFTFIPGYEIPNRDTINTTIGDNINGLRTIMYDDWRTEYNTLGTEKMRMDYNASIHMFDWSLNNSDYAFYDLWVPNALVWEGYTRPWIGLKITCNDCSSVSINPAPVKQSINVYPNPANSILNIELNDDTKAQVELYSLVGQLVYREETNVQRVELNVGGMPDGVYMLKVTQNGVVYTSKVIVK